MIARMRVLARITSSSRRRIINFKHLCGVFKDIPQLTNDTVRRDDRHIGFQTVGQTLIDVQNVRLIDSAGADDLGRHGRSHILLTESQQRLPPPPLHGISANSDCSKPQPGDFF